MIEKMHDQKTLQGVREVYDRAFEVFASRTGRNPAKVPGSGQVAQEATTGSDWRSGLTASEQRLVQSREALSWSEHLMIYEGQRRAAFKLMLRAWMLQPLTVTPLRTMLRLLLPTRVVRGIVTVKRGITSRSASAG